MAKFIVEQVNLNDVDNTKKVKKKRFDFYDEIVRQAEIKEKQRKGLPIEPDSPFVREYFVTDYNPNMLQFEKDRRERQELFKQWREEKGWDSDPTPYTLDMFSERVPDKEEEERLAKSMISEKVEIYVPEEEITENNSNEVYYTTEKEDDEFPSTMMEAYIKANSKERLIVEKKEVEEKPVKKKKKKYPPIKATISKIKKEDDKQPEKIIKKEEDKKPIVKQEKPRYKYDLTSDDNTFNNTSVRPESDKVNSITTDNKSDEPMAIEAKPKNEVHITSNNTNKKYLIDLNDSGEGPTSDKVNLIPESDKVNSNITDNKSDEPMAIEAKPKIKRDNTTNDYIDKDLSLVMFNMRLLDQAMDKSIPLFERINFLSIADSNMDEFCRVRFAKKYSQVCKDPNFKCIDGNNVSSIYKQIKKAINKFINTEEKVYKQLMVEMNENKFELVTNIDKLSKTERKKLRNYYDDYVGPLLTPLVFDNTRPFPMLKNDVKYLGLIIRNEQLQENLFGAVEVPNQLNRFVEIKSDDDVRKFILLEDIIYANIDDLYTGRKIVKHCVFRVLRKYDYTISDDSFISNEVESHIGSLYGDDNITRLDITDDCGKTLYNILTQIIGKPELVYKKKSIIDYKVLSNFMDINLTKEETEKFKYKPIKPAESKDDVLNIFDRIDNNDILLQHPYESYNTVVNFINTAAEDPNVLGIKQTLYRVSSDSPIISALLKALKNGKQVTVVAEVKARFDELNNIKWAKRLSDAGGQIIYGTNNLKVHGKMCLVTRINKKGKIKQYLHVGTGNYNEKTSKIYTDISYLTSDKAMMKDANKIFNSISGSNEVKLGTLIASPFGIHDKIIKLIDKEIEAAKRGEKASIVMKMNGLTEKSIINKLYEAADNGVDITLIVRGACSLFNTSKIKVKSIIGQFLEHSRIYRFKNSGTFMSSADMMERNLFRRVELLIPIKGDAKDKLNSILDVYMNDKSAYELIDGEYKRNVPVGETEIRKVKVKTNKLNKELSTFESVGEIYGSQEYFFKCAEAHNKNTKITNMSKIYQKTKKGEKKKLIDGEVVDTAKPVHQSPKNNTKPIHKNRIVLA